MSSVNVSFSIHGQLRFQKSNHFFRKISRNFIFVIFDFTRFEKYRFKSFSRAFPGEILVRSEHPCHGMLFPVLMKTDVSQSEYILQQRKLLNEA